MNEISESFLIDPINHDQLADTLARQPASGNGINVAVGNVISWTTATRRNQVSIMGGVFTDLPAIDTPALATMVAGNNVLVLMIGNQWIIQGRILDPI